MDERDAEAFRSLYRNHYPVVCRYLALRTDREVVEDVAAETFLVAWRRHRELPAHVVPWLLNTAAKCLANQRRSRERAAALTERLTAVAAPALAAIEHDLERSAQARALLAALGSLDERDRELLLLRHWDELAPREIAAVLELNPTVVRARLHRAARRLERALAAALEHEDAHPCPVEMAEAT